MRLCFEQLPKVSLVVTMKFFLTGMFVDMKSLVSVYCLLIAYSTHVHGSSPLCDICPCSSQPNQPPAINCVAANIPDIYDKKYWFDEFDESYRIGSLILQYNNLKSLKTKFPFSELVELDLSHNLIDDVGLGIFSQLQNMRILNLGHNNIERLHPDSFKGVYEKSHYFPLRSLKKLDLRYNKIHSLHPDTFEHIDEIQELNLSHNTFNVIDAQTLQAIASLVYLAILNLSYTQIKTLPTYFLHAPKYLTHLDLSGNYFASIPDALQYSHSLTTLYFNKNPIRNLSTNAFPHVPTLKSLHMSHMLHLQSIAARSFAGLPNLEELYLTKNNFLSSIHQDALLADDTMGNPKYLPILKLSLDYNNLSIISETLLPAWENLEKLNLHGNPWECSCSNEWLITDLVPLMIKLNQNHLKSLNCASPTKMQNMSLYEVYAKEKMADGDALCKPETIFKKIVILYMAIGVLSLGAALFLIVLYKKQLRNCLCGSKFHTLPTSDS